MKSPLIVSSVMVSLLALPGVALAAKHVNHSHHVTRSPVIAPSAMGNPTNVAPFPSTASDRAPPFGRGSREGSNEVETILGNNPMTSATYSQSNVRSNRIDPILGPNPMSGTP